MTPATRAALSALAKRTCENTRSMTEARPLQHRGYDTCVCPEVLDAALAAHAEGYEAGRKETVIPAWTVRERNWYATLERRADHLSARKGGDFDIHEEHALRWALGLIGGMGFDAPPKAREVKPVPAFSRAQLIETISGWIKQLDNEAGPEDRRGQIDALQEVILLIEQKQERRALATPTPESKP